MAISKEEMLVASLNKVGQSLTGINGLMTSSFEMETYSSVDPDVVASRLSTLDGGSTPKSQKYDGINNGNGWNSDAHMDGTVNYSDDLEGYYDLEVSSSPLNNTDFDMMRVEIERMLKTLGSATQLRHSCMASCHIHTTIRYAKIKHDWEADEYELTVGFENKEIYNRIARFMLKYMPVMKWLSMTCYTGARGSVEKSRHRNKNGFDRLENDGLFNWFEYYDGRVSEDSNSHLLEMERQSYFRIHSGSEKEVVHWENRMHDQTASHTQLALNISLTRAITLWAIDMSKKGYNLQIDSYDVNKVQREMRKFRENYMQVDIDFIKQQWKEMKGYLTKYLSIMDSMNAIQYGDKLVDKPVSSWVIGKGWREHFDPFAIEQVFNERNRGKDESLRNAYWQALDSMAVEVADSLNEFHQNVARFMDIDEKQAKSLYQMFNRENVDIRFLGGRLVLMGE